MVTRRECELCKGGLEEKIEGLRREIRLSATVTVTLVGVFISILGILLKVGVI